MNNSLPLDKNEFNKIMIEIDNELSNQGKSIQQRSMLIPLIISERYKIQLPTSPPPPGLGHESFKNWPITQRIREWFDNKYGSRQKIDFKIGRMVFLIKNDIWHFCFPKVYGSVKFVLSKDNAKANNSREHDIYNVLDYIKDLPNGMRESLDNTEMKTIFDLFRLGYDSFTKLNMHAGNKLVEAAISDISTSVNCLLEKSAHYGASKWSSLQSAEKLLKYSIEITGNAFPKTHELHKLTKLAKSYGLKYNVDHLIDKIQCTPAIRYGDEQCSKEEAIYAQHAGIKLANEVL